MAFSGGCLLVVLPLLAAGVVDLPEADGRTRWVDGRLAPGDAGDPAAWELEVRPAAAGWVWVEVDGPEPGPDLDLTVEPARADGERRRATSHVGDEALLVATTAGTALLVRVTAASGREGAFRVGVTPLASSGTTDRLVRGVLDPQSGPAPRAHLVELDARDWDAARLLARRTEGAGDVDVVVLDERLDVIGLGLADGAEERCQPAATLGPRWALLLVRDGPVSFELGVERKEPRGPSALERFLRDLARTPEQRRALEALARTPDFVRIRHYVDAYPGGLPLRLRAVPGLRSGGVERFGTYSRGTLTINPAIAAHEENVQELLDTLVHELVHALLDLPRGPRFPLGADVLDAAHDPRLREVEDLPVRKDEVKDELALYLDREYGPSASDPLRDYSDINAGTQRLIVKIIDETLLRTSLGRETIVFESVRGRSTRAR